MFRVLCQNGMAMGASPGSPQPLHSKGCAHVCTRVYKNQASAFSCAQIFPSPSTLLMPLMGVAESLETAQAALENGLGNDLYTGFSLPEGPF